MSSLQPSDADLRGLLDDAGEPDAPVLRALQIEGRGAHLRFGAAGAMTVCGIEAARRLFELCGAEAECRARSGEHVPAGVDLLHARGPLSTLLRAVHVARGLVEFASGVASEVARIATVLRAAGYHQTLACDPLRAPGLRALAVAAVEAGGGVAHGLGAPALLLLTAEHRLFLDGAVEDAIDRLRGAHPKRALAVPVDDLGEALAMAEAGAEVLVLQRFGIDAVRTCRAALRAASLHPKLVVTGDVDADNALAYADAGSDVLVTDTPWRARPATLAVSVARADTAA